MNLVTGTQIGINDLPEEIRGNIFRKLPQSQVLKLRLVCKEWKRNIQTYVHVQFKIGLNDCFHNSRLYLDYVGQLRISRLTIVNLSKQDYRILEPRDENDQRQSLVFSHPNLITELRLTKETEISCPNLSELLQFFSKSIKSLSLALPHPAFASKEVFNFQELTDLRIDLDIEYNRAEYREKPLILAQLAKSQFPKLKSLDFKGDPRYSKRVFQSIMQLINKNPAGLQRVSIHFGLSSIYERPCPVRDNQIDLLTLKTVTNLEVIKFDFRIEPTRAGIPVLEELLSNLFLGQSSLRIVELQRSFPLPASVLRSTVGNNFDSLSSLTIDSLSLDRQRPFDLSILNGCTKLQTLCLKKNDATQIWGPDSPELINLRDLPTSILTLRFHNFTIRSEELGSIFEPNERKFRDSVELLNCGDSGVLGVNAQVLNQINIFMKSLPNTTRNRIGNQKLNRIRYFHIIGFNGSDRVNLKKTFKRLCGRKPTGFRDYGKLPMLSTVLEDWYFLIDDF